MNELPSENEIRALVADDQPETTVIWAERIGQRIARQVTTSQIRNIYTTVRQIQTSWDPEDENSRLYYRQAILLKPKLGYVAARDRGLGMKDLESVLNLALNVVIEGMDMKEKHTRFIRFAEFFEAILAYHKKYGGN